MNMLVALKIVSLMLVLNEASALAQPKRFVMIGLTGAGKSTLGNCILNNKGDIRYIHDWPFETSDGTQGCTQEFTLRQNDRFMVLDTIGFNDADMSDQQIIDMFRRKLQKLDGQVDALIFVQRVGRFDKQTVDFYKWVHERVLDRQCVNNSVLIVNGATADWVKDNIADRNLQTILNYCNHKYYEFYMRMDLPDDSYEDIRVTNVKKREDAIGNLTKFLEQQNFKTINLKLKTARSEAELKLYEELTVFFSQRSSKLTALLKTIVDEGSKASSLIELSIQTFKTHFNAADSDQLFKIYEEYVKNETFDNEFMLWLRDYLPYYKHAFLVISDIVG